VLSWYINSDSADPSFVSNQTEMAIHQVYQIYSNMDMISKLVSFVNIKSEVDPIIEPKSDTSLQMHVSEASLNTHSDTRKKFNSKLSVLKLNFTVKPKHLAHTAGGLSLKCTAEVLDLYWRSSEVTSQVKSLPGTWSLPAFSNSVLAKMDMKSLFLMIFKAILIFIISI
jgi:hypothetical protein